jgi:hypothetical protein
MGTGAGTQLCPTRPPPTSKFPHIGHQQRGCRVQCSGGCTLSVALAVTMGRSNSRPWYARECSASGKSSRTDDSSAMTLVWETGRYGVLGKGGLAVVVVVVGHREIVNKAARQRQGHCSAAGGCKGRELGQRGRTVYTPRTNTCLCDDVHNVGMVTKHEQAPHVVLPKHQHRILHRAGQTTRGSDTESPTLTMRAPHVTGTAASTQHPPKSWTHARARPQRVQWRCDA